MTDEQHLRALPPGEEIGEYVLERVLGAGSFGITYYAIDTHLDMAVAIKEFVPASIAVRTDRRTVAPVTGAADEQLKWGIQRFVEEGRALAKLRHPNVLRVLRLIQDNGTAYMVTEYEPGETLTAFLDRNRGRIDQPTIEKLVFPLLDGLAAVHAGNFLHRDIKPDNIFLRDRGGPMLIDFGAARETLARESRALTSVLTEGYAPFEQYSTDPRRQGPWTDLYALGATLYRAITGDVPPDAALRTDAMLNREDDPLRPLADLAPGGFAPTLLEAIDWAMAAVAKDRPQSVAEWRKSLEQIPAAGASSGASAPALPKPAETAAPGPASETRVLAPRDRAEAAQPTKAPTPAPLGPPAPADDRLALPTGTQIGGYVLEQVLGSGAFSITYLARDEQLNRSVVFREFLPAESAFRDGSAIAAKTGGHAQFFAWGLERFLEEGRALARFSHPNVLRMLRLFEANGTAYMVTEYAAGRTLTDHIDGLSGRIAQEALLKIVAPLLDGLTAVHQANYLHRDIKPDNIYLRDSGGPMLIDFSMARDTSHRSKSLTIILTPGYAPPEQYGADSKRLGPWTDVYAFGATLYRAIVGETLVEAPFRIGALTNEEPDPYRPLVAMMIPGYSQEFLAAIDWALRLRIKDRPQSVEQWRAALLATPMPPVAAKPNRKWFPWKSR